METKVSESMQFSINKLSGSENWLDQFKEKIDAFTNAEDFRNTHVICVENNAFGHKLQHCHGVTIALDWLRKNPKAKVVLYGALPMEYLRLRKPEIDIVLKHDNARFIEMPFALEAFASIFTKRAEVSSTEYKVTDEVQKYLSVIFHDLRYVPNWDTAAAYADQKFQSTMEKVRDYFPSFAQSEPSAIIEFLKSVSDSREEVMKGVKLSGVYCDVEGTILVEGKLNLSVVTRLQEFEQQGKTVTLWSDGNIEKLKQTLLSLGVTYLLKSKFDHAGAIAEIVLDDQDEYTFGARTKISAETFIRV